MLPLFFEYESDVQRRAKFYGLGPTIRFSIDAQEVLYGRPNL